MPSTTSTSENRGLPPFEDLNGYEKGVVARAFLNSLIKQGNLESVPKGDRPGEIVFPVKQWQLELLARFNDDIQAIKTDRDILLEKLRKLS